MDYQDDLPSLATYDIIPPHLALLVEFPNGFSTRVHLPQNFTKADCQRIIDALEISKGVAADK